MAGKENSDILPQKQARIATFVQAEARRLRELIAQRIQSAQTTEVPGGISGRISQRGEVDYYKFSVPEGKTLGSWWVIQPLDNPNETGFDIVYPPEMEIDLDKEYIGKGG